MRNKKISDYLVNSSFHDFLKNYLLGNIQSKLLSPHRIRSNKYESYIKTVLYLQISVKILSLQYKEIKKVDIAYSKLWQFFQWFYN